MESNLRFYLGELIKNEVGTSDAIIAELQQQVGFELPHDYIFCPCWCSEAAVVACVGRVDVRWHTNNQEL